MHWLTKQKRYRKRMAEMGLCRECGKPARPGSSRCGYHLEKLARKARERRRARRKTQSSSSE